MINLIGVLALIWIGCGLVGVIICLVHDVFVDKKKFTFFEFVGGLSLMFLGIITLCYCIEFIYERYFA
jgi:hypothetical protein